jgi:hypothetical protein
MDLLSQPGGALLLMGLKGAAGRAQFMNLIGARQWQDPFYYEFWLRPISDQHTETPYVVNVSKLLVPRQIDLGA